MTIDEEVSSIKRNQGIIYHAIPSKWLLYGLLGVTLIAGIDTCNRTSDIKEHLQKTPTAIVRNVIGKEAPEKFYEINGQRVYLEVDGKPVEQYFRE